MPFPSPAYRFRYPRRGPVRSGNPEPGLALPSHTTTAGFLFIARDHILLLVPDLSGNPFQDVESCVDALSTLGDQFKRLKINLFEEEQVDYLLRNLEQLEELNGLKVERDVLF